MGRYRILHQGREQPKTVAVRLDSLSLSYLDQIRRYCAEAVSLGMLPSVSAAIRAALSYYAAGIRQHNMEIQSEQASQDCRGDGAGSNPD